jgi:hypothetical protein
MLEYIFFDERPWGDFIDYLQQLGLEVETARGEEDWMVYVSEDLDDELDDKIEFCYEQLLDENDSLMVEQKSQEFVYRDGIRVTLTDGRVVQAVLEPGLMSRLLDAVSTDELGELANAIAHAMETGAERSMYQR